MNSEQQKRNQTKSVFAQLEKKFPTATEDQIDNTIERWIEKDTWKSFIKDYQFDKCIGAPHATQEILYPIDYAAGAAERDAAAERSAASRAAAAERAAAAAERAAAERAAERAADAGQRAAAERAAAAAAAGDLSEKKIAELLQIWDKTAGISGDDMAMIPTDVADRRELFVLGLRNQLRRQRMGLFGGKRKTRRQKKCRKSRCQKLRRRKSRRLVK